MGYWHIRTIVAPGLWYEQNLGNVTLRAKNIIFKDQSDTIYFPFGVDCFKTKIAAKAKQYKRINDTVTSINNMPENLPW